MLHQDGHFNAADELDIFYQSWRPDGPPKAIFLIVHGLGEHSGRYQNYVDHFAPRGYALYALDTRGHGRSGGRRGHVSRFDDYVIDVRQFYELVRAANPDGKIIMLGHSLGSLIALAYASRYPDGLAGVIASATALRDALDVPGWLRSMAGGLSKIAPALAMDNGVKTERISHDPAVVAAYDSDPLVHHVGTLRLAAEVEIVRSDLLGRARDWTLPLLMLHGADDRICLPAGARAFYDQTDHARVELRFYQGLYHEIHNEIGKQAVFKDIEEWLARRI